MTDKLKLHTPDLTQENINKISQLFPNCICEGKIDFDLLKQELSSSVVEGQQERYQLNWVGKKEALISANTPIHKTLRPNHAESVDFDTTKNLYIEGDNLDALKLLQETYLGKVKMIYIDPPYNTGNDFIYHDDLTIEKNLNHVLSGHKNEEGDNLIAQEKFKQNSESNGRFHSDWLSMTYPRLKLARNLLKDDGVIFISIDDNEQANLKRLCDEVFGEQNFVASFVWKTRQASGKQVATSNISLEHEYLLCYLKTALMPFKGIIRDNSTYKNPDNDPRGIWAKHPLDVGSTRYERPNCFYDLIDPNTGIVYSANPNRVWAFSKETMNHLLEQGKIIFHPEGKTRPSLKKFFSELKSENKPISTWLQKDIFDIGYNAEGTKLVNELFDNQKLFDYPKPVSIVSLILEQVTSNSKNDIILDFFSGSATTAHAVMQLNAEDGGNRQFIMVQLPESCDDKSEAFKAGYKTITEIGKERIRRAGQKIKTETGKTELDIGFRVLKVDSSNMNDVYYSPDALIQNNLLELIDNIKPDRTDEDLLFQVLLDWGIDLTSPIEQKTVQGKTVFVVAGNAIVACFDRYGGVTEELITELAKEYQPLRAVFCDGGFASDNVKINITQIFKMLSPATEIKTI